MPPAGGRWQRPPGPAAAPPPPPSGGAGARSAPGPGEAAGRGQASGPRCGHPPPRTPAPYLQGADLLLGEVVGGGALGAEPAQVGQRDVDEVLEQPALLQRAPHGRQAPRRRTRTRTRTRPGPRAAAGRRRLAAAPLLPLQHAGGSQGSRSIHSSASGGRRGEAAAAGGAAGGLRGKAGGREGGKAGRRRLAPPRPAPPRLASARLSPGCRRAVTGTGPGFACGRPASPPRCPLGPPQSPSAPPPCRPRAEGAVTEP
uniref:Uncharacterized protein n=1 Tax=Anser brachyrhynchus TaxID=132585 RepID=A0A8B9CHC7_9AVES